MSIAHKFARPSIPTPQAQALMTGCWSSSMRGSVARLLITGLCFALVSCLRPVEENGTKVDLISQAISLENAKQLAAAKEKYLRALDLDGTSIQALEGLGRISLTEKSWQDALRWYEKILRQEPNNIEAHYDLAYAYRERGRERYWLEKMVSVVAASSFDKARTQFEWVISRDSLYRDVLYQYALVYYSEREYPPAIAMALKQVLMKPDLRQGHIGLFKIVREFIATRAGDSPAAEIGDRGSDYNRFFIAEWERRNGRIAEAERDLKALLEEPRIVPPQLILQALARVNAKQGLDDETERRATEAIEGIKTMAGADIVFDDIKYIVTDGELHAYQSLSSGEEAKAFFKSFWGKRNPNPTSETNVRIVEHYRRLVYAEENFQVFGPKTFAKSAGDTWVLNFPESYYLNEEFNDKGMVFLHHGEPDQKVTTASATDEPNESWYYRPTDQYPEMLFDFHVMKGTRAAEWRLVPVFTNPALWSDRAVLSQKYSRILFSGDAGSSTSGMQRSLVEAEDEGKRTVSEALSIDSHKWSTTQKYLESPVSVSCYRSPGGKTLVDIGYVITPAEIARQLSDTLHALQVSSEFSMNNGAWVRVASDRRVRSYGQLNDPKRSFIEVFHAVVPPDSYAVAWQARPVGQNLVINKKLQVRVSDFSGSALQISDIELAYAIEPAKQASEFQKWDLLIIPNPLRRFVLNRPLYLYFEVYNLTRDPKGKSSYTIEYQLKCLQPRTSFLERILGLGKKSSISFGSSRGGVDDWSPEHISLDVGELEPGQYELQVSVTDEVKRSTVSRSSRLEIIAPG